MSASSSSVVAIGCAACRSSVPSYATISDSASDVDVLVEFEPEATVGYFSMSRMEQELTEMFGRRVDLRTPKKLSCYFRDKVLADAQEEYVA